MNGDKRLFIRSDELKAAGHLHPRPPQDRRGELPPDSTPTAAGGPWEPLPRIKVRRAMVRERQTLGRQNNNILSFSFDYHTQKKVRCNTQ